MTKTHLGKQVFAASGIPSANTATEFEALTWVRVNGFVGGFQLGFAANNVDIPDIAEGITLGAKGMRSGNDSTASFRNVASDTGQANVKGYADDTTSAHSLMIISAAAGDDPGTLEPVQYAQGYFHSFLENEIAEGGYEGFSVNFKQNAVTVNGTVSV
jgi:hypothetical protein